MDSQQTITCKIHDITPGNQFPNRAVGKEHHKSCTCKDNAKRKKKEANSCLAKKKRRNPYYCAIDLYIIQCMRMIRA